MGERQRLTKKQRVFVEEYLRCWNGAEAARIAGYKYPRNSAYENFQKPYVAALLEKRIQELKVEPKDIPAVRYVRREAEFVYLIRAENGLVKIGITINVEQRFRTLDTSCPVEIALIGVLHSDEAIVVEAELHERFEDRRVKGEWFALSSQEIAWIKQTYGFDE